jgi:hypothetical protein
VTPVTVGRRERRVTTRTSLEDLVLEGNREARRRRTLCLILAFFLCLA